MGRSRLGWAAGAVAPWCLGLALVVSFSADAGTDASIGASLAPQVSRAPAMPGELVPSMNPLLRPLALNRIGLPGEVKLASLNVGEEPDFRTPVDEIEPRIALKAHARSFPSPDRSHRGDPVIGLRPSFDADMRGRGGIARAQARTLLMSSDDYLAFDGFAPSAGLVPGPESVAAFEPVSDFDGSGSTQPATGNVSPAQSGTSPILLSAAPTTPRTYDGATPSVPRAVALASATPATSDRAPVEVVEIPVGRSNSGFAARYAPNVTAIARSDLRPNYAALIDQDSAAREERCLAEAIYFEARSEPEDGQAAVAQVVLNRVSSGLYPTTICGVVYQNRQHRNACQFSFACEGKSLRITEPEPWQIATRIARDVLDGKTYVSDVGGATHYHANYVRPRWARALKKIDVIGHHIFYELRPGQT